MREKVTTKSSCPTPQFSGLSSGAQADTQEPQDGLFQGESQHRNHGSHGTSYDLTTKTTGVAARLQPFRSTGLCPYAMIWRTLQVRQN